MKRPTNRDYCRRAAIFAFSVLGPLLILLSTDANNRFVLQVTRNDNVPVLPKCVVETCTTHWKAPSGPTDVNMDFGACSHTMHMIQMERIKPNITGHWCKVWLAKRRCEDKRYRWMIFRDDDTKLDVHRLLEIGVRSGAGMVAPMNQYKYVTTNWFLLDTHNEETCSTISRWWAAAKKDHPEHDQKYFNVIFECGKNGLHCVDKFNNNLNVVHCRSRLGNIEARDRQACMRYQIETVPEMLRR